MGTNESQEIPGVPPLWSAESMLSVGSVVAGYRIEEVLGTGGMGTVYLAKNPTLPRRDALKVLSAELSRDRAFRDRFVREADIASLLDHPGIVSIYGRGETDDGQLWIALQYVEGTDAEAALQAGAMTPQRAVHIVSEVAKALDYAHHRNVVHHDVKPANLLLSDEIGDGERVFLSDFGVARPMDESADRMDGAFTATLAYSAPEVITGAQVDGRSDIYSLGCTLFRLLTGRQPYAQADGVVGTIRAHLAMPQPRVSDHLPWATPELDQVIARALAKDPAQRFGSAREFASAAAEAVRQAAPPEDAAAPHRGGTAPDAPAPRRAAPAPSEASTPAPPTLKPLPPAPRQFGDADFRSAVKPKRAPVVKPRADKAREASSTTVRREPDFSTAPPPPVVPRPAPRREMPKQVVWLWAVAAVLMVAAGVLITMVIRRETAEPAPATPPAASSPTVDAEAQTELEGLLPAGYPSGRCEAVAAVPVGARAVLDCGANVDAGGPVSATYTLAQDAGALQASFDEVVGSATTVVCPGNILSPGPWRRNADPTTPAGTLFCGVDGGDAVIAWTTDADLLLNVVRADRPAMEGLYRWWSAHS